MRLIEEYRPVAVNRSSGGDVDESAAADIRTEQAQDHSDKQAQEDVTASVVAGENSPDDQTTDDQPDHQSHG